ncbi:acyl-CoA thioesterase [Frigidibacter sp. ROC022]|uniref:acyl-CoA thioesterase n=1 Tax=Frigidibacter sp. ROC022 TaxID=2971796 RepID=UPI00215B603A|nr:thioesterase family protein [Frigidibacter sp. ROC022]MCR8723184.1 acyl-CoA thioesterase [Frigidibacter sp. ROC022]
MAFTYPQKVLFKYCDPAGIVFFPRYFELINDCIETFFGEAIGVPFEELMKVGGVPTVEITATFKAPSRHGDRLLLSLSCRRIGRTSATLDIDAHCSEELRFRATSTIVHVDRSGRPEVWPARIKDKLQSHLNR